MEPLFEGLTASEIEYLKSLQEKGYYDGIEMFLALDTSTDYRIEKFVSNGYVILENNGPYDGSRYITITGKGVAALVNYDKYRHSAFKSKILKVFSWIITISLTIAGIIIAYLELIQGLQ